MEIKLIELKTNKHLQSIKNEEMREVEISLGSLTATILCNSEPERNKRYIQFAELVSDDISACNCILKDEKSFRIRVNTSKIQVKIED